jgi:hypothetical protein
MNQLRPILRGNPTRAQKLVLCSAQLDQPPSHGKSRTLAALGLGGTLVATTQVASAVTASSVSSTSAATAAVPVISLGLAVLKGIAAGLLAGSVVYGVIVSVRGGEQQSPRPSEQQQGLHKSAPPRGELRQFRNSRAAVGVAPTTTRPDGALLAVEAVAASASPQTVRATESTHELVASAETQASPKSWLPPARSSRTILTARKPNDPPIALPATTASATTAGLATTSAATAVRGPAAIVAEPSPLESEIAILDSAQRALAAGLPSVALQNLDTHHRLFPNPHLLPEATLVRIESLLALGRSVEARKLGEQLLAAQPTGALSRRVRSLLNQPQKP